jgi:hypothetical protein
MPLVDIPSAPVKAVPKELFVDAAGNAYYRKADGEVVAVGGLGTNKITTNNSQLKLASVNIITGSFTLTMPNSSENDGIMFVYKEVGTTVTINVQNPVSDLIILRDEEGLVIEQDTSLDYNADVVLMITKIGDSFFVKTM